MTAQPPTPTQKELAEPGSGVPDDREQLVEAIAHLLSAGRPFSDVLDEAKKLAGHLADPISNDAGSEPKSTVIEVLTPSVDARLPSEADGGETQDPLPSGAIQQETRLPDQVG